jgi:hypothetical protein
MINPDHSSIINKMKIIYFIINNLASLHRDTRKQIKYVPGLQIPRHASLNTAVYQDSAKIMLLLFTASMRSATLTAHTSGPLVVMLLSIFKTITYQEYSIKRKLKEMYIFRREFPALHLNGTTTNTLV